MIWRTAIEGNNVNVTFFEEVVAYVAFGEVGFVALFVKERRHLFWVVAWLPEGFKSRFSQMRQQDFKSCR